MALPAQQSASEKLRYTYEDYVLLPEDGKRYEILEGGLFMTPAPNLKHQNILSELGAMLRHFVLINKLGNVFYSPCDVVFSEFDVVQPDIVFVAKENRAILTEKNIQGAPDLVVEITSPATEQRDVGLKKKQYARFGVKEYGVVLSEQERVEVWTLKQDGYRLHAKFGNDEVLASPLLQGLQVPLADVFKDLDEYF